MLDTRGARLAVIMLTTMCVLLLGAPTHATDECVTCHTNLEKLKEIVSGLPQDPRKDSVSPAWIEGLKPLTRAEKVLVKAVYLDKEEFLANDDHGDISCGECHGGDPEATDFEAAHKDLVTDPSYPAPGICMDCHDYDQYENTVHYKGGAKGEKCTATCGNCHISRPAHIGGGLVNGHLFDTVPTMNATCNTCHSGIAVGEYTGRIQGLQPDVHFQESEMHCAECHTGDEVHISSAEHTPNCLACHEDVYGKNAEFKEVHSLHRGRLSCQVCHAQGYAVQEPCSGEADPKHTPVIFKIGLNPKPSEKKPEKFVTLAPVTKDGGQTAWSPISPHNIRRRTEQAAKCNNCHGIKNKGLFLLTWDVDGKDRVANRPAIVPPRMIPKPVEE